MRLEQKGVGYESNFKPESVKFSIGDPRMLISIVRDKLYSDKLRVFLQEYISNAVDANKEAGKPKHDMTITMPTKTEPLFKVRDNGPGLSPERVRDVFVQFGVSTKRDTDKQIGGFGIGAKSAWAYTDSFVVQSFHEGIERHYLCHIGEDPEGSMSLLHEGPTDEPNGVEIQVQVKEHDVDRAQEIIRHLLTFWDKKPKVLNVQNRSLGFPSVDVVPGFSFGAIQRGRVFQSEYWVSIGGVPHRFEDGYLSNLLNSFRLNFGTGHSGTEFVFFAETGAIDVAANRENIELNDKYYAWVDQITRQTIQEIHAKIMHFAGQGFEPYVRYWLGQGQHLRLRASRQVEKDNKQYEALSKLERDLIEGFAAQMMLDHETVYQPLVEAQLIPDKLDMKVKPTSWLKLIEEIDFFCFYFKNDNVVVIDSDFFPLELRGLNYIYKGRPPSNGRSRRGKELFQVMKPIWYRPSSSSYRDYDRGPEYGLPLSDLNHVNNLDKMCPISYNDEALPIEKIKPKTSRVAHGVEKILDTPKLPKCFDKFGVKPLSKVTRAVERYGGGDRTPSIRRKTGSVREIKLGQECYNMDRTYYFQDYQESKDLILDPKKKVVYVLNDEIGDTWKTALMPYVGRMMINGFDLYQVNKTAIEYLKKEYRKVKFIHWSDWLNDWKIPENGAIKWTETEIEMFAGLWMKDQHKRASDAYYSVSAYVNNPVWKELYKNYTKTSSFIENRHVKEFIYRHRNRMQSLRKSKIYTLRNKIVKQFPLLPILETALNDKSISKEDFALYLTEPRKLNAALLKAASDDTTWLNGKQKNWYG